MENKFHEVEETKIQTPNVLAFELVMGKDHYYFVGIYIPPSDLTTLEHSDNAWCQCSRVCMPLLIGNSNVDLESPWPRGERDEAIAEE